MSWTGPAELRAQVQRLWDRGDLLRAAVGDGPAWPLRLVLKMPSAADLSDRFEDVRAWVQVLADMPRIRLEWREWNHRVQGAQRLPAAAWLDSPADALALVGKTRLAQAFAAQWADTQAAQPALTPWLMRRPLQTLELAQRWDRLLAVVAWVQAHPRPSVHLRQVDVPGVDSKFIEAHRSVLAELLDLSLPPDAIESSASGVSQFARRYGFREKPVRVRFRPLDTALGLLPLSGQGGGPGASAAEERQRLELPDITLDADSFAALSLPVQRVFITENETNFLAFPTVDRAIVVFGAGYGWDALARAHWLQRCELLYWGDIDTHGFAILDQLRGHFPKVASFLMDRDTLLAHEAHWGEEPEPARHPLQRLQPAEAALYSDLTADRYRPRLRLEQERVGFGWLEARLLRGQCPAA
jgi:hypothetical protein